MVKSILQFLWVIHSPNLHLLFILTWSTDATWWFVSLTYISCSSDQVTKWQQQGPCEGSHHNNVHLLITLSLVVTLSLVNTISSVVTLSGVVSLFLGRHTFCGYHTSCWKQTFLSSHLHFPWLWHTPWQSHFYMVVHLFHRIPTFTQFLITSTTNTSTLNMKVAGNFPHNALTCVWGHLRCLRLPTRFLLYYRTISLCLLFTFTYLCDKKIPPKEGFLLFLSGTVGWLSGTCCLALPFVLLFIYVSNYKVTTQSATFPATSEGCRDVKGTYSA